MSADPTVFPFLDRRTDPDPIHPYKGQFDSPANIICIDNGKVTPGVSVPDTNLDLDLCLP